MRSFFKSCIVALLTLEARAVLKKYKPSIIAVTGSVGKTSTKDAIYAALAESSFVRKSEKSFNSDIGIPLTVLGAPNAWLNPLRWAENLFDGLLLIISRSRYPDWLVLEVGADRPGDIRKTASWLPVDIAVITRLPEVPVHVEYFDSPEEVIEEKAALIAALKPTGALILFADDARTRDLASRRPGRNTILFGFAEDADIRGKDIEILYAPEHPSRVTGMRATIATRDESAQASVMGTIGEHSLLSLLAAAAVGFERQQPLAQTIASFEDNYLPPPGRMHLIEGAADSLIIDDTYNASPAATVAALETLASLKCEGKKIAIIGDMLELGRYSVEEHRKLGALAAKSADMLITVGFRARDIAEAALDNGMQDSNILQYEDSEKAGEELLPKLGKGDMILVKGSQSMRMEKTVKALMADPLQAPKLLVRQEEEWEKR